MDNKIVISIDAESLEKIEALTLALNRNTDANAIKLVAETPTSEEISNEPVPKPTAETKPEVKEEKKKKEPKKKAVTIEAVRAALNAKAKKDGFDKALEIVKDLGAENVNQLDPQFYEKCIELCQA